MLAWLKCSLTLGGPFKDSPLLSQIMQRLHFSSKIKYKCAVVARQSAESVHFGDAT